MDILLSPEERASVIWEGDHCVGERRACEALTRAQHQRDALYLEEPCPHVLPGEQSDPEIPRRYCDACWSEFIKEAKP